MRGKICLAKAAEIAAMHPWLSLTDTESVGRIVHRKHWEKGFVCDHAAPFAGRRMLGFGCGNDRLATLFAGRGAQVVATDLPAGDAANEWASSGQYCSGLGAMAGDPLLHDMERQGGSLAFRPVDMRDIPSDLRGFDVTWSVSALDHLGSVAAGREFILRSLDCLTTKGIAIHTTEYRIEGVPLASGPVVAWEREHLEQLGKLLGLQVDLSLDATPEDTFVDSAPYRHNPHMRVLVGGTVITSVGIVIHKD